MQVQNRVVALFQLEGESVQEFAFVASNQRPVVAALNVIGTLPLRKVGVSAVLVVAENSNELTEHLLQKPHRGSLEITLHLVNRVHVKSQTLSLLDAGHLETALVQQRSAALVKQGFQLLALESSQQIYMVENRVFHAKKLENSKVVLPA